MANKWKWYVYQFFAFDGSCVYVGKGCAARFNRQCKRFNQFSGAITAYFKDEQDALKHEKTLILTIAPAFNKALMPVKAEPWKYSLLPTLDSEFGAWCDALGTRQMAARVLLSKPWSYLEGFGVNIKGLVSKVEGDYIGAYYGSRC